jgi:hypothetical protein
LADVRMYVQKESRRVAGGADFRDDQLAHALSAGDREALEQNQ